MKTNLIQSPKRLLEANSTLNDFWNYANDGANVDSFSSIQISYAKSYCDSVNQQKQRLQMNMLKMLL